MMYYGGSGSMGWIWMAFSMIAFWGVVAGLVIYTVRALGHSRDNIQPASAALSVLEERMARGEISPEEFTQKKQLIAR